MRKFILRLLLLLGIAIFFDIVLGYICDVIYANTQKGDYGRNHYICTQVDKECLIFGSSRAIHQLSPRLIQEKTGLSCYNCGDDGMGIVAMYGRYQLIRQRFKPKVILYDVVAHFDLAEDDKTRYIGILRYYLDNEEIASLIDATDDTERYKNWLKTYKYNSRFVDIVAQCMSNAEGTASEYDYTPLQGIMKTDVDYYKVKSYKVDSLKLSLFEELIKTCKKDKTNIIFIISPWYKATADSEYAPLYDMCQRYSVPILNHFMDKDFITSRHLFKDSSHLNEEGAILFCNKICEEINTILK